MSIKENHARWRARNKAKLARWGKQWQDNLRDEVLLHYGGRCACCGETIPEFLIIDHIHNDGAKHRQTFSGPIYRILKAQGFPDGYQVLCWNCNAAKSLKGGCPHQRIDMGQIVLQTNRGRKVADLSDLLTINAGG